MRLVGRPVDVYQYLEPLYNDFRKVRVRESKGAFALSYVDQVGLLGWPAGIFIGLDELEQGRPGQGAALQQTTDFYLEPSLSTCHAIPIALPWQVVDDMLTRDYCFDIALPRLPARKVLEEAGQLQPRVSVLDEEFDEQALAVSHGDRQRVGEGARGRERSVEGWETKMSTATDCHCFQPRYHMQVGGQVLP